MPRRTYWHSNHLGVEYEEGEEEVRVLSYYDEGNLISSFVSGSAPAASDSVHMPALDIDHVCHLKESETPGHFHLLIDVPMSWTQYAKLLNVLVEVGILEEGYVNASFARGQTFLARKPWKLEASNNARP